MKSMVGGVIPVFIFYLLLTAGSGDFLGYWSVAELVLGLVLSVAVVLLTRMHVGGGDRGWRFRPWRWLLVLAYVCGPFLIELTRANLDVAWRVITGRIRPGVIRVKSGMKGDVATTVLASSITLTPGTLTLGVDEATNDLFVHKIHLAEGEETKSCWEARALFSRDIPGWIRRFAE